MADGNQRQRPDVDDFARWLILGGLFSALGAVAVTRGVLEQDRFDASAGGVVDAGVTVLVAALGVAGLWLLLAFARRGPGHAVVRLAAPLAVAALCIGVASGATWMFTSDPVRVARTTAVLPGAEDPIGRSGELRLTTSEVDVPPDWEPAGVDDGIAFFMHERDDIEGNVVAMTYDGTGRWTRSFVERFMLECIGEIRGEQGYRQRRAEVVTLGPTSTFVIDFDVLVEGEPYSSRMQVSLGANGMVVTTTSLVPPGELDTYDAQLTELARVVEADLLHG